MANPSNFPRFEDEHQKTKLIEETRGSELLLVFSRTLFPLSLCIALANCFLPSGYFFWIATINTVAIGFLVEFFRRYGHKRIQIYKSESHDKQKITESLQKKLEATQRELGETIMELTKTSSKLSAANRSIREFSDKNELEEIMIKKNLSDQLHDTLGQSLAASKAKLQVMLDPNQVKNQSDHQQDLSMILRFIEQAIAETRMIIRTMNLGVLKEYGLAIGLQEIAKSYGERLNLKVSLYCDIESIDEQNITYSEILLKATGELLANISKHAKTNQAFISLIVESDDLMLTVSDQGCGFDSSKEEQNLEHGYGLLRLKQMLNDIGARIEITSKIKEGTRVCLRFPLIKKSEQLSQ